MRLCSREVKCEATRNSISGEGLGSGKTWGLQGDMGKEARLLSIWNWRGVAHVPLSSPGQRWLLSPDDCSTISRVSCCDAPPPPRTESILHWQPPVPYRPKRMKNRDSSICIHMFISILFTIAKKWKNPNCPSTDEWINQL